MNKKVFDKRKSLVNFIEEQILGPGINGYKYIDIRNENLSKENLISKPLLEYCNEILDVMPASVYSTGILFPKDESNSREEGIILDNNEVLEQDDGSEVDEQNNSTDSVEETDTIELNQMFPTAMGLTFCVDNKILDEGMLNFDVKARYYSKIDKKEYNNISVYCEVSPENINGFLNKNKLNNDIEVIDFGLNKVLKFKRNLNNEELGKIKKGIRESLEVSTKKIFESKVEKLLENKLSFIPSNMSSLLQTIYNELQNTVTDKQKRERLYTISQEIELLENISGHIKDLIDIHLNNNLWRANSLEASVKIKNISFPENISKKSYLYNKPLPTGEDVEVIYPDGTAKNSLANIFEIPLSGSEEGQYARLSVNLQLSRNSREHSDNRIYVKVQLYNNSDAFQKDPDGKRYYSVATEKVNNKAFFGVKIKTDNTFLIPYSNKDYKPNEEGVFDEDTTSKFIYDQYKDYAIGHSCSVKWIVGERTTVETEYIPSFDTPDVEPTPRDKTKNPILNDDEKFVLPLFIENNKSQQFKWLSTFSDAKNEEIVRELLDFVNAYGNWIENKRQLPKYQNQDIAIQELNKCQKDYERMKNNIHQFLEGEDNSENLSSFRLMNNAMFMQLWHSQKVKTCEEDESISALSNKEFQSFDFQFYKSADDKLFSKTESVGWRAFQLAFILLNLDGIYKPKNDSEWKMRNEWVDLVWFPTGGGKTEAYLGLIALTIINRRKLYEEEGGGVTAIMRYTLRLLTMQQFQRATLVIMALELIRRWNKFELGEEPITVGLWVGDNSIPNKTEGLLKEYEKLREGQNNKIPYDKCPWCHSKLNPAPEGIINDRDDIFNFGKVHLYCSNNKCSFSRPSPFEEDNKKGALPVCLSDEIIYQHPPTLLFGTVDKFAQLAHKVGNEGDKRDNDSRRLFGKGNWEAGKPKNDYLPPDLIIQDELHLLLGPLGSAVALFETAVNQLCTREDGTRPKVISSTATTRNTDLQIAALFNRKVNLFPKPGVECDDSFYAFYERNFHDGNKNGLEYISKRKYIGLLPTGRTQIWMQMRLTSILLTHRALFELQELGDKSPIDFKDYSSDLIDAIDYYHTVISYFNSLKEVGKTQSQVQTYIVKEVRRVFNRVIRPKKLMNALYTYGDIEEAELTGRLSGEEVKTELQRVEARWNEKNRFAHNVNGVTERGSVPPEFVVATNMISVGIDVSRFNSIIMNSMPRNTAEYIQASSRVARDDYGLVLTIHHPFRARDISHYEKFIEFHEKMYSYVEPISITPFTRKSVERYMGLYLATMIRHTLPEFSNRTSANEISNISDQDLQQIVDALLQNFRDRKTNFSSFSQSISNLLRDSNLNQINGWIKEALNEWKNLSDNLDPSIDLVFNNKSNRGQRLQEQLYVDIDEYSNNGQSEKWKIPMSLRVIEPGAVIKINSK